MCASTAETQQRPVDVLAQERPHLQPLNPNTYDLALTSTGVASSQFRITLDTNHYSVPAAYAHRRLTVKAYPDRVCIYFDNQLIARHTRQLWPARGHRGSGPPQGTARPTRPGTRTALDDAVPGAVP